ncbi:hypothetical protein [Nonomuraea jabiensis]|uniref:hypothetical protein n=1 Tax=Nonomuraea jabiensis TaxID=882448 RepID=UPI003D719132
MITVEVHADGDKLAGWLAINVAHAERQPERVREELLEQCRAEPIEPPSPGQITRMVCSTLHNAEQTWFARIVTRLDGEITARVRFLPFTRADRRAGPRRRSPDAH